MIIAVNARTLRRVPKDGIGWFTYEVIRRMAEAHREHRFVLFCDRKHDPLPFEGENIEYVFLKPRNIHPVIWWYWHEVQLSAGIRKINPDVLLSTDGLMPLRLNIPCISVIHDLNHEHRPQDFPPVKRSYYRHFFPLIAKKAERVATVSDFSADDIASTYGIERKTIDVVYNGVGDVFSPPVGDEAERTRQLYTGGRPYFLFVSNFSPRKNLETLIKAYDLLRKEHGTDHVLLLAGRKLFRSAGLNRALASSPYSRDILFTGSVTPEVLRKLYGAAEVFTFVPWHEGFGIPVVEAMRCGAPCIISDTTSLPEVSGGAALCAGPAGAGAIADAMARLVSDEALRRRLSQQGIINSQRFSWNKTAEALWNTILKTLDSNHASKTLL